MGMIDTHTHIGRISMGQKPLTVEVLVSTMDRLGIEKAVVLPIENPEELHFYSTTEYVLSECGKYPGRLIPFCNVDPRRGMPNAFDPAPIIKEYKERGCRGFGECLQGLPINDPRSCRLYAACGELGLPIVIHIDRYFNYDEVGLPGFERVLAQYPATTFIAHGPRWWSEISSDVDPAVTYPRGRVKPGGRVDILLEKYKNLYADLSAGSGYNALTRDLDFSLEFLERHRSKLLFATDYLSEGQELPIIDFIKKVGISRKAFRAITRENARKLLHL